MAVLLSEFILDIAAVPEWNISVGEAVHHSFFHAFARMFSQAIRKVLCEGPQHGKKKPALRSGVVNIFRDGAEEYPLISQLLKTL